MSSRLNRLLDVTATIAVTFLALYLGSETLTPAFELAARFPS